IKQRRQAGELADAEGAEQIGRRRRQRARGGRQRAEQAVARESLRAVVIGNSITRSPVEGFMVPKNATSDTTTRCSTPGNARPLATIMHAPSRSRLRR